MVLIDPFYRTVTTHRHDGNFQSIAQTIRDPQGHGSGYFTIARAHGLDIMVDDQGLFQKWVRPGVLADGSTVEILDDWPAFHFAGYGQALSGRALVAAADARGRTVDCPLSVESIEAMVSWGAVPAEPTMRVMSWDEARRAGLVSW